MALYTTAIEKLYVTFFNRPADFNGLNYWEDQVAKAGGNSAAVANAFSASAEYKALYAGKSTATIIDTIYQNLFGRGAEPAALSYWGLRLDNGTFNIGTIANSIAIGAQNADITTINNKVAVATAFTAALDTNAEILGYEHTSVEGAQAIKDWLKAVTSDAATLTAAQTALPALVIATVAGASTNPGQTFTLTTGTDNFAGTAGNDTFNAGDTSVGGVATAAWTTGDAINGGAGTDVFNVISNAAIAVPTAATVTGVETVNLTSGATVNVNTTAFTGLTALNTTGVDGATVIAAATTAVSVTDAATTAGGVKAIAVNGGSTVSVTSTNNILDTITIGATATGAAAAGAVTVTSTGGTADTNTAGAIAVTGGTTVTVNQNAGNAAATGVNTVGGAITVTGNASTTAVTVNQTKAGTGLTATATAAGVVGYTAGGVTIADVNAASATAASTITTVTLNSFGDVGGAVSTVNSGALTTINLSGNAIGAGLTVTNGALTTPTVTTQALNLNGFKTGAGAGVVTLDTDITTLNVTSSTAASTIKSFVAAGVKTLNIAGDAKVTLTAQTLAALTDVVVTNTAGASLGSALAATVNFTGGAGADSIVLSTGLEKAITMGDGDDTVTYGGVTSIVATKVGSVAAGNGTDTIKMTSAQAEAASASAAFNTSFTGFEVLDATTGSVLDIINLAAINGVNQVVARGTATTDTVTFNGFSSGGTLTLDTASAVDSGYAANVTNAILNPADVFNVRLSNSTAATVEFGVVTLAGVETVNITTVDAGTTTSTVATVDTATLVATSATKIVVAGNNGLTLVNTGNAAVTTFDASGVVGNAAEDTAALLAVSFTSANTTAAAVVTITGGAGNDTLTGNAAKDTIVGGAGADNINGAGGIDTLTGGTGIDKFILAATAAADRDVITDFVVGTGGDTIQLTAANTKVGTAAAAAPVVTADTTVAGAPAGAYTLTGVTTATADVIVLQNGVALTSGANGGDLSASTNGSELLKALTNADAADAYTGITSAGADGAAYLLAYQGGNAYLYVASDANADGVLQGTEIALIGTFNTVAANGLTAANYAVLV